MVLWASHGEEPAQGGYDLTVSDLNQASVDEIVAAGAKAATNAEIGETCDVVLTMVPNSPQVKAVMLGEDGVAAHMKPGSVFIDMSSINPVASKEIAAELAKRGIEMLDAPSPAASPRPSTAPFPSWWAASRRSLTSTRTSWAPWAPLWCAAATWARATPPSWPTRLSWACNIQALSEALTLAKMAGVDPELVFQAIRGGLAGSTVMNAKAPMMIEGNDKPGFKIDLHIKDLNNALDCAHTVGSPCP